MKTVEFVKANKPLRDYAKRVDQEAVVVVKNGKPLAVLSSAKGMDAESIALANNPKFVAIIQKARARHKKQGGAPIEEMRRRMSIRAKTRRKRNSHSDDG